MITRREELKPIGWRVGLKHTDVTIDNDIIAGHTVGNADDVVVDMIIDANDHGNMTPRRDKWRDRTVPLEEREQLEIDGNLGGNRFHEDSEIGTDIFARCIIVSNNQLDDRIGIHKDLLDSTPQFGHFNDLSGRLVIGQDNTNTRNRRKKVL